MKQFYKTRLLMLLSFVMAFIAAEGQISMVVNHADGSSSISYQLDDINKLAFEAESFTVDLYKGEASTFALKNVLSIKFKDASSGISSPSIEECSLYYKADELGAIGELSESCLATVYDVSGRVLLQVEDWDGCPIDVTHLSKGLYLFNANNQTLKFKK